MQPYGAATSEPETGTTSTVKTAVALTMGTVALALVEAMIAVYMLRQTIAHDAGDLEEAQQIKTMFGILIAANLMISGGLAGGAILTLRRSVAGKAMIWGFGVISMFLRLGCGSFSALFAILLATGEEKESSLPFPGWVFWVLVVIEVLAFIMIIIAMIMLMTRGASFKNPPSSGPPAGSYGAPYGSPAAPPMAGPPGAAPPDGLPNLPPTAGWPGG